MTIILKKVYTLTGFDMRKKAFSFSQVGEIQDGKSTVQILRTGSFKHPSYGTFDIQEKDLEEFENNFNENKRGVDLVVDENHDPTHKAVGWFRKVYKEGQKLYAEIEWNKKGLELLKDKVYRYFSPELYFEFQDEETGEVVKNLLIGGGITNRPFFKNMEALAACEPENETKKHYFFNIENMKTFKELHAEFSVKGALTFSEMEEVRLAFSELSQADQTANASALKQLEGKFNEDDSQEGKEGEGQEGGSEGGENNEGAGEGEGEGQGNEGGEGSGSGEGAGEGAGEGSDAGAFNGDDEKAKEFSETMKKVTGLSIDEVKAMQKQFNEQARVLKFNEVSKKVDSFVFNENSKEGFILPKGAKEFSEFLTTLTDAQVSKFFEILPKIVAPVSFSEKGVASQNGASQFSISKTTPSGISRESFVLDSIAKQYCEKNEGVSYESALMYAEKYVKENSIK